MEKEDWYASVWGKQLLALEREVLHDLLVLMTGYYVVQIGGTNQHIDCNQHASFYRVHLTTKPVVFNAPIVEVQLTDLPFQAESIDLVLLIHSLGFCDCPVRLLHEVYQALRPGGRVLILEFNPRSIWAMTKLFSQHEPWSGRFFESSQVKYWLRRSHYTVIKEKTFAYSFPSYLRLDSLWTLLTKVLERCDFLGLGGVFLIVAEKQSTAFLTPGLAWWKKDNTCGLADSVSGT